MSRPVEITQLTVQRGAFTLDVPSLSVEAGSVVGLVGRNAAGKTTLLQVLSGQLLPASGTARVFGLECKLVPAVVAMERAGMPVDAAGFERIAEAWRHERATAAEPDRIARLDKLISTYAHWPRDFVRADRIL